MQENTKNTISAVLLFTSALMLWQWWMSKKYPQPTPDTNPPASSRQSDSSAPTAEGTDTASQARSSDTDPTNAATNTNRAPAATGQWQPRRTDNRGLITLGDRQGENGQKFQLVLDQHTGSIAEVLLSEHRYKVDDTITGYPLVRPIRLEGNDLRGRDIQAMMLGQCRFTGQDDPIDLSSGCWQLIEDRTDNDGGRTVTFRCDIIDTNDQPVCQLEKQYHIAPGNYEILVELAAINLTGDPLEIEQLTLFGPSGVLREDPRMDYRTAIGAYEKDTNSIDAKRLMLKKAIDQQGRQLIERPSAGLEPMWFGVTNKFFAAILHPLPAEDRHRVDYLEKGQYLVFPGTMTLPPHIDEQGVISLSPTHNGPQRPGTTHSDPTGMSAAADDSQATTSTPTIETVNSIVAGAVLNTQRPIPPGQQRCFQFELYLGPIDKDIFDQPHYVDRHYEKLIPKGGCSFCAFDWLTYLIVKLIKGMYHIVHNYGIAIIVLVLMTRLLLHPITKAGQVSMMGMQKMAPKIEEIKTKYANNPQEIQRRTMEVYKEQGATPILGCLPMVIQMPIWIALYTAVNMNVAVRHKGLFPAHWGWLNDLSSPDALIPFSAFGLNDPIHIPLLGNMMGPISSFNLLPILLVIAMVMQQKMMPKPPTAQSNPQMAQQQKMMLWMMPVMMLLFLYNGPSGLNLYIMASSFAGVVEQRVIRKHIREKEQQEQEGPPPGSPAGKAPLKERLKNKNKKPRPPKRYI